MSNSGRACDSFAGLGRFCLLSKGSATIGGVALQAVRLSYVGEAGWEMTCAAADAPALFDAEAEA